MRQIEGTVSLTPGDRKFLSTSGAPMGTALDAI
jgi:hypothetical protein